jgi:hypothetical protein
MHGSKDISTGLSSDFQVAAVYTSRKEVNIRESKKGGDADPTPGEEISPS